MRFSGGDGSALELSISGYQFPELIGAPYDSNWLVIAGRAQLDGRAWKFSDPCLLTSEASALADWLEAISDDPTKEVEIGFIEPNLNFTWTRGSLQVQLGAESGPPRRPEDKGDEACFYFSPSLEELDSAARSLREALRKYPIRPEREGGRFGT